MWRERWWIEGGGGIYARAYFYKTLNSQPRELTCIILYEGDITVLFGRQMLKGRLLIMY